MVALHEDLHWVDSASEQMLLSTVNTSPTLVILNFRPEYRSPYAGRPNYTEIALRPLAEEDVSELLADLLGSESSRPELVVRIQERSGGNPFYVEEIVQSLVETGHLTGSRGAYRLEKDPDELEIPDSVQGILAARIDRLGEEEKRVLQTASVIGRTFELSLLEQLTDLPGAQRESALRTLCDAEFLYIESVYPEQEYTFKHALTQEVAYQSQLQQTRQVSHLKLAAALVEIRGEKLDEAAALIAHHLEAGGEPVEAARWHTRAGEWAGTKDAAAAASHARKVLDLVQEQTGLSDAAELGWTACQRLLISSSRLGSPLSEVQKLYALGRRFVTQSSDAQSEARLENAYAQALSFLGDLAGGVEHAVAGRIAADRSGDLGLRSDAHWSEMFARFCLGDLRGARATSQLMIDEARRNPELGRSIAPTSYPLLLMMHGLVESWSGDPHEALRIYDDALELSRASGETEAEALILGQIGWNAQMTGDLEQALDRCEAGLELAQRTGSTLATAWCNAYVATVLTLMGENQGAVEHARRGVAMIREHRVIIQGEPLHCAQLAEACLAAGDLDAAREAAEEGIAVGQRIGARFYEGRARLALAAAGIAQQGVAAEQEIRGILDETEAIFQKAQARNWQPFIHEQRSLLAKAMEDDAGYEREREEAKRLFTEMGSSGHVRRLEQA